ncbi:hypothetical protein V4T45_003990 [Vibrio vulnificus]|nr:hypothetical protein [Vibrio vulnificus]ELR8772621.1 hypothetical protein [Vibrio vulnificus]
MKKQFLTLSLALLALNLQAATFKADLTGSNLRWDNVVPSGSTFVPTQWTVVDKLMPTKEWFPAGLHQNVSNRITLRSGSDSVTVTFEVLGFEYNTGSTGATSGDPISNVCNDVAFNGGIARVADGVGCYLNHSLKHDRSLNPYSFIRPVVKIDTAELINAFDGKPKGLYVGQISTSNFYDYLMDGSGIKTRFIDNHNVGLEINYIPAFVTKVDLAQDNIIPPVYDKVNDEVWGHVIIPGVATGYFTNGLKLSLQNGRSDYYLKMAGDTSEIPYYIECLECQDLQLVKDGAVVNSSTVLDGKDVTEINFNLKVGFDATDLGALKVGTHSDTIVFMFEPNI